MALQLAERLNGSFPIVLISTPVAEVPEVYRRRANYQRLTLRHVKRLADGQTVFISHHRKTTLILLLFQALLFRKLPIVHVAHSTFVNLRWATWFPKRCVAISQAVRQNMIDYFKVPKKNITVIYDGVKDLANGRILAVPASEQINILFAGRLCKLKQQVRMAEYLQDKLPAHVQLYFAGEGEDKDALLDIVGKSGQMHYLGQIDLCKEITRFHYVLLFSEKEGLSLTLLESCMFGRPMLTNNIPVAVEVNKDGITGFVYADFQSLADGLGKLPLPGSEPYKALSRNARKEYETKYREEIMVKRYEKLLDTISREDR